MTGLLVGHLVGQVADNWGHSRLLGALAVVALIALLGLGWTSSLVTIALSAVFLFLAGTGLGTVLDSPAADLAGLSPGRFMPAYNTWQDLGAAVGLTLAYGLPSRIVDYRVPTQQWPYWALLQW